jgi:hypothetical protein
MCLSNSRAKRILNLQQQLIMRLEPLAPCPKPHALCPLPSAPCTMPFALRPLPHALCPLPCALCPLPHALCPLPYALCPKPHALCPLPYALCPLPQAPCTMPFALCPAPCCYRHPLFLMHNFKNFKSNILQGLRHLVMVLVYNPRTDKDPPGIQHALDVNDQIQNDVG